jgi:2-iminobutanoate/2-iminopropanoate deaminase
MNRAVSPSSIAPPAAKYVHAVLSEVPQRLLHTSGVVPVDPDGSVPADIGAQAETVWANIQAMLTEAQMAITDIVSITTYAVTGEDLGPIMAVRDRVLGGHLSASTLVTVPELAQPAWRMEIAVVAAA